MRETQENIHLGTYPYTYARTSVMKSLLLKEEEYTKLMKMSISEIIRFLQESVYKKEIDKLAASYSGYDLLELALNRNLGQALKKLERISPEELQVLIRAYILRNDITDIKNIIRGKHVQADEDEIIKNLPVAGTLSEDFLKELVNKESVEAVMTEALKVLKMIKAAAMEQAYKQYKETNSLFELENELDKSYYSYVLRLSEFIPEEGKLFNEFLLNEIEIINIITFVRLFKEKMEKRLIKEHLIFTGFTGKRSKDALLLQLLKAADFDEVERILEKTKYRDAIKQGLEEFRKNNSLIKLEISLQKYLMKMSSLLIHQHPLSVDIILGYMLAKDVEVKNLKMITKGKQLGIEEGFLDEQVVIS